MRFAPQILDEIRARLPISQVVGRKVTLKKKGREFWGLSPFKTEKTPSFSVNDIKGFYHCFATQEHGDIFTFLIKTEGVSFPEAVERLAAEAGVSLPKQERAVNPERENERARLLLLMSAAADFFVQQLFTPAGRVARDYLVGRHIDDEAIAAFGLGYAPDSRNTLKAFLSEAGFSEHEMIRSGMLIGGEDIRQPYDRFRHRVIFPIHDLKGRVVAFGGRALRAEDPAKYLNSPETPLFHKGRLLYNAHRAREHAFRTGEVIAVEGYMDAIALTHAGNMQTVAPLGTALTADQLQMMWRLAPEPVMCFDGDQAGRRAAYRALDTALPMLKPGYSLRFAFLSDGLDPDDLIRQQGNSAMRAVLDQSKPFADVLWQREWEAGEWSTPERRAALETRLRTLVEQISDADVKSHYRWSMQQKLRHAWRSSVSQGAPHKTFFKKDYSSSKFSLSRKQKSAYGKQSTPLQPERAKSLQTNSLVAGGGLSQNREASLLRALVNHPCLLSEFAEIIAELEFNSPAHLRLRDGLLLLLTEELELDTETISNHMQSIGLAKDLEFIMRAAPHKGDRFAEPDVDGDEVRKGWRCAIAAHNCHMLRNQLKAADQEYRATGDETVALRIIELKKLETAAEMEASGFED